MGRYFSNDNSFRLVVCLPEVACDKTRSINNEIRKVEGDFLKESLAVLGTGHTFNYVTLIYRSTNSKRTTRPNR